MLPRPSLLKSDRSSVANIESPSYQTTHAFQMSCPSQVPGTSREINERPPFLRHFPGTALKNGQPVRDTKLLSGILLFYYLTSLTVSRSSSYCLSLSVSLSLSDFLSLCVVRRYVSYMLTKKWGDGKDGGSYGAVRKKANLGKTAKTF